MNRSFVAAVLVVAGATCFVGAAIALRVTLPLVARGRLAVGVVKSYEPGESSDSDAPPVLYAVVHFNTPDGHAHSFLSNLSLRQGGIGQRVEVIYDPEELSRVRVNSWQALWLGPALAGGMGLICVVALVMLMRLPASRWTRNLPGEI